jgi:hypothetical protein
MLHFNATFSLWHFLLYHFCSQDLLTYNTVYCTLGQCNMYIVHCTCCIHTSTCMLLNYSVFLFKIFSCPISYLTMLPSPFSPPSSLLNLDVPLSFLHIPPHILNLSLVFPPFPLFISFFLPSSPSLLSLYIPSPPSFSLPFFLYLSFPCSFLPFFLPFLTFPSFLSHSSLRPSSFLLRLSKKCSKCHAGKVYHHIY